MSNYRKRLVGLGLALGVALGATQGANAAYVITQDRIDPSAGSLNGTLHSPNGTVDAAIGRIQLTGTDNAGAAVTLESFCVDIAHYLTPGTFTGNTLSALGLSDAKNDQLVSLLYNIDSYIATNAAGTGSTAERSAAAQMAIWEIVTETSATYDVSDDANKGIFYLNNVSKVDNLTSVAMSDAATLLANVTDGTTWTRAKVSSGFKVALLMSPGDQTQIVYGAEAAPVLAAVPEPATWGMMVMGFGVLGAALRRKRGAFAAA